MHHNWRDCQEWEREGLKLSTTSNTACKLYDAALTQLVGWYDDPVLGGLKKTSAALIAADPQFVMGRTMALGLEIMASARHIRIDPELRENLKDLVELANNSVITDRERMHVNAINLWANGNLRKALLAWEDILVDYPCDMHAIRFANDGYFYLGKVNELRDEIARVLPRWNPSIPLYSYVHGFFAFGLQETNRFAEAVKHAKIGLDLNRHDAWATHALAHVYEGTGSPDTGIKTMRDTESDWNVSTIAGHNYWHLALYYVDKGDYEAALTIFDAQLAENFKTGKLLYFIDGSSLLYRLELEGVNVGNRWQEVYRLCKPHIHDHITCYHDFHYTIAHLRSGEKESLQQLMSSMSEFIKSYPDYHTAQVAKTVGYALCEAITAYGDGDYQKVVNLLNPIRYQIIDIGGSHAQRDLFELLLIHSALKSSEEKHRRLAKVLLMERQIVKGNTSMTERLMARAVLCH